ncbi:hypothetical protein B5P44_31680 [Mycobacterium sp. CBMA 213]|nr:hypothetical protein [Mycolicibacterium sp. CBMA 213]
MTDPLVGKHNSDIGLIHCTDSVAEAVDPIAALESNSLKSWPLCCIAIACFLTAHNICCAPRMRNL